MPLVAIIKCDSYEYNKVHESVERGINLLGGVEKFVIPGEKILLKPNLLMGADPGKSITTHPSVFKAVAEIFKNSGANLSYGDNPGVIDPFSAAKKAGLSEVAHQLNIKPGNFRSTKKVYYEKGRQNKVFNIVQAVFDNDGVISLPKFKTHNLTRITGCVKNQFGCLPFMQKRGLHAKLPDAEDFAKMLLDLNQCIKPRLYIMDSIYAMEGDGPVSGNPFKLNVLGFSSDPIALDSVMCRIINLEPSIVPTISYGHQFRYGEYEESKIQLVGDRIEEFVNKDFKVERRRIKKINKRSLGGRFIFSLVKKPTIVKKNCIKCGTCVLACPVSPKALFFKDQSKKDFPEIDYKKCIRCYCCHELCPEKAIKLKTPGIITIIQRQYFF